MMIHATE